MLVPSRTSTTPTLRSWFLSITLNRSVCPQMQIQYFHTLTFSTTSAAKGNFVNQAGLKGFAMYEAGGDFDDILLDSITNAAGFEVGCD